MGNMKIWVIGRNYPDGHNNRQGSFELEQAKMLAKRGNEVVYIYCRLHSLLSKEKNGSFAFQDEEVAVRGQVRLFTPHYAGSAIRVPYFPKIRNRIWTGLLAKAEQEFGLPDVIHIHYPTMMLAADVFAAYHERGVKIVATEHWSKVLNQKLDSYEISQLKAYLDFADAFLCVGPPLRRSIEEMTGTKRKIRIMPNIVNDAFFPGSRRGETFRFGAVGRLSPGKQIDRIIDVFARIAKEYPEARLILVGDGKERAKLQKQTVALQLAKKILFTGSLSREQTAEKVRNMDCLVMFSRSETFGVPMIEAWASGIPVITSAFHIMEHWDERLGFSVDCRDSESLYQAMKQMIENRSRFDKNGIAEYARQHYSEAVICQKLTEIYQGVPQQQ